MFTTVKSLTALIDSNLRYVEEAKASKEQHEESKYNEYMEKMKTKLQNQLKELKRISSNKSLIDKYDRKVTSAF